MSKSKTEKLPPKQLMSCGEVSCEVLVNPIPRPESDPIKITLKPNFLKLEQPFYNLSQDVKR